MDILNPTLINIDGRIYCVFNSNENCNEVIRENVSSTGTDVMWEDEPPCEAEACSNVEKTSDGRCKVSLSIPSAFFKYIIGIKGDTKRRLEHETRTKIQIPGKGHDGDVTITGRDSQSVLSAKNRIDLIVSSKRWKEPFTHFISIPLHREHVKTKFEKFENFVMQDFSTNDGIHQSIFQNPCRLHLTICTLVLLNDTEVAHANKVLRDLYDDIVHDLLGGSLLEINLRSLEYMNDDPAAVDVLYGKVRCLDDSDRLQLLADKISEAFVEAGLSERKYDRVKLHCTLMNSKFRRGVQEDENRRSRKSFDASSILMKYQDFNFGNSIVTDIHLSKRGSYSSDGYYAAADSIVIG